jgi:hypothetical protein
MKLVQGEHKIHKEVVNMNNMIKEKGDFKLLRPFNSWDMNYHLVDTKNELDHLIDIEDVYSKYEVDDMEVFEGLLWEVLKELDDIEYIMEFVWRTIPW